MDGRRLVRLVFEGEEGPRLPMHVESDDKGVEAALGDVVGVGARIPAWRRFYEDGGPFHRREGESLGEWVDRVVEGYEWPDVDAVVESAVESFRRRAEPFKEGRFIVFKLLGPTETAESFFAQPVEQRYRGQLRHRFGFGAFYSLRRAEASLIYSRISEYILEAAEAGGEIEWVDAVRLADDAASYSGPIYPRSFYEELYMPWHSRFSAAVKRLGKYAVLHCDGDIRRGGLLGRLASMYDGLHPLDLAPKPTLQDGLEWARLVAELRSAAASPVFFTGLPVELLFNDQVGAEEFAEVPSTLVGLHGRRRMVLATTHSEYPGRSYAEQGVSAKIEAVRRRLCA